MIRKVRWLPIALVLAGMSACCTGAFGPTPGLSHDTRPRTRAKRRPHYAPVTGTAIEKTTQVDGVGEAIVIGSPTPAATSSAAASPTP